MGLDGNVNAIYLAFHVNSGIIEASAVLDQMLMLDDSQYKLLTNSLSLKYIICYWFLQEG